MKGLRWALLGAALALPACAPSPVSSPTTPATDATAATAPPAEWLPPTAADLWESGLRVEIKPVREGRQAVGATARGEFGRDYYCLPQVAWPEACAAGRTFGPVAPGGHPKRVAWEAHFMGQSCATFSVQGDMSFNPWIVLEGIDQNHPRNVLACGHGQFDTHASWVYRGARIVEGQWSWASVHGSGRVCAAAADGVGLLCVDFP